MTTEVTNDVVEETTEEVTNDRSISDLLELDNYEGLTDTEVRRLIEYKVNLGKMEAASDTYNSTCGTMVETNQSTMAAVCASSQQVLESIIASTTNYEGVSPTAVTNLLSSLEEV